MGSMEFDEEVFRTTESRLDQIHDLQRKYGNTTQLMLENLEKKKNRLEELENFDAYRGKNGKRVKRSPGSFRKMLRRIIQDTKNCVQTAGGKRSKKDCWI